MKNNFPFLGLGKPDRSVLQADFIRRAKKDPFINWEIVFRLWDLPEREFQYLAVEYLLAQKNHLRKDDIAKLKTLLITKSWWDTVDSLAAKFSLDRPLCPLRKGPTDIKTRPSHRASTVSGNYRNLFWRVC